MNQHLKQSEEREKAYLELDNLRRANKKLKNEWWHLLVSGITGSILTLCISLLTIWLSPKESQSKELKSSDTLFVKEIIHTNQKDTL